MLLLVFRIRFCFKSISNNRKTERENKDFFPLEMGISRLWNDLLITLTRRYIIWLLFRQGEMIIIHPWREFVVSFCVGFVFISPGMIIISRGMPPVKSIFSQTWHRVSEREIANWVKPQVKNASILFLFFFWRPFFDRIRTYGNNKHFEVVRSWKKL